MASLCKNLRLGASHLLGASNRPLQTLLRPNINSQSTPLRAFHNIAPSLSPPPPADFSGDITKTKKASPAHYLVKIDSFSSFKKRGIDKFETKEFQAGGHNWKLIIYPNGDRKDKYGENVSVKLALADKSAVQDEVNAVFSICLFNYESGYYNYAVEKRSFDESRREIGFPNFISKKFLTDPTSGYLKDDQCVFGAEVFVDENKAVTEYFSLKDAKFPYKREIKISDFASVKDMWNSHKTWTSEEFTAGGHTWKISIYRNGYGESKLGTFLHHVVSENSCETVKATYTVSIENKYYHIRHEDWARISRSQGAVLDFDYLDFNNVWYNRDYVNLEVKIRVEDS